MKGPGVHVQYHTQTVKPQHFWKGGDRFSWQYVIFYIWFVKGLTSIAAVEIHRKYLLIRKRNNRTPLGKVGRRVTQDGSDSVSSCGGSLIIW